jgi:hypothetical protein
VNATITANGSVTGISGDTVNVVAGTASFDNANVGSTHTVTGSSFSLDNTNYVLSAQPVASNVSITPKALNLTANAVNAIYGDTLALSYTFSGLIVGDSLTGGLRVNAKGSGTILSQANGFAVASSPYSILQGTLNNANYTINYTGANLRLSAGSSNTVTTHNVVITNTLPTVSQKIQDNLVVIQSPILHIKNSFNYINVPTTTPLKANQEPLSTAPLKPANPLEVDPLEIEYLEMYHFDD